MAVVEVARDATFLKLLLHLRVDQVLGNQRLDHRLGVVVSHGSSLFGRGMVAELTVDRQVGLERVGGDGHRPHRVEADIAHMGADRFPVQQAVDVAGRSGGDGV